MRDWSKSSILAIVRSVNIVEFGAMQTALLIASIVGIVFVVSWRPIARSIVTARSLIRAVTHGGHNE